MNAIEKQILQAQIDIQYKQALLDAQGEPLRELERAQAALEQLKLEASTYEANKEKHAAKLPNLKRHRQRTFTRYCSQ